MAARGEPGRPEPKARRLHTPVENAIYLLGTRTSATRPAGHSRQVGWPAQAGCEGWSSHSRGEHCAARRRSSASRTAAGVAGVRRRRAWTTSLTRQAGIVGRRGDWKTGISGFRWKSWRRGSLRERSRRRAGIRSCRSQAGTRHTLEGAGIVPCSASGHGSCRQPADIEA
jgi:hypothetical protein